MKVFQELIIQGPEHELRALPDELERLLDDGWTRSRDREADVNKSGEADAPWADSEIPPGYCFHCEAKGKRKAASLWLFPQGSNELKVTNIVPSLRSEELSPAQYNQILEEFTDRFVRPAADKKALTVLASKPDVSLGDLLPPEVAKALREFSQLANKSTGASHPLDQQRWEAFIVAAHRAQVDLDSDTLRRWLVEEERWPAAQAEQLSSDYEQARSILEEYDRQLQDA